MLIDGRHGNEYSTTYPFHRKIMPEYTVISVGADNLYGHPDKETLSRLRNANVKVFRTDMQGTIICASDGKAVSFSVAGADTLKGAGADSVRHETPPDNSRPESVAQTPSGTDYVLNTNSNKFHYPSCPSVSKMSEKNRVWFLLYSSGTATRKHISLSSPAASSK